MSVAFDTIYKEHLLYVTRLSRKLARGDRDLVDDLAQEGWLALLKSAEARWGDAKYVRTVLTRAMHHWLRRERGAQVVTLEQRPVPITPVRRHLMDFPHNTPRPYVQRGVIPLPPRRRAAA